MWIVFKLVVAILAFFYRAVRSYHTGIAKPEHIQDGVAFYLKTKANKKDVYETQIGIPLKSKSIFRITRETQADKFFKKIGLADEIQTTDKSFDNRFYIASDSTSFRDEIKLDEQTRNLIAELFKRGCEDITGTGRMIWFGFFGDHSKSKIVPEFCAKFYNQISEMEQKSAGFFNDPFAVKILITECAVWSLAAYSVMGFGEWYYWQQDVFLNRTALLRDGVFVGSVLTCVLLGFIFLFMKGSSRAHRILVESALVLGFSIPVGGIHIVRDINMNADTSIPNLVEAEVLDTYTVKRRRKRRSSTDYYMRINPQAEDHKIVIPQTIEVSNDLYNKIKRGDVVILKIRLGYLNHPWFEEMTPKTTEVNF